MIHIGFTVWNGYFSQRFSEPLHPWSQEASQLAEPALHGHRCHTEKPVPRAYIKSWLGTPVTQGSLSPISVLFLCWLGFPHLECPLLTSICCLKSSPAFKTHQGQALFPRIKSRWLTLGPSENFHGWKPIINPCGNWSRRKHLSRKCLENTREKDC